MAVSKTAGAVLVLGGSVLGLTLAIGTLAQEFKAPASGDAAAKPAVESEDPVTKADDSSKPGGKTRHLPPGTEPSKPEAGKSEAGKPGPDGKPGVKKEEAASRTLLEILFERRR